MELVNIYISIGGIIINIISIVIVYLVNQKAINNNNKQSYRPYLYIDKILIKWPFTSSDRFFKEIVCPKVNDRISSDKVRTKSLSLQFKNIGVGTAQNIMFYTLTNNFTNNHFKLFNNICLGTGDTLKIGIKKFKFLKNEEDELPIFIFFQDVNKLTYGIKITLQIHFINSELKVNFYCSQLYEFSKPSNNKRIFKREKKSFPVLKQAYVSYQKKVNL